MKHFLGELIVAVVFLVLLFALANPWDLLMPTYIEMVVLAALVVLHCPGILQSTESLDSLYACRNDCRKSRRTYLHENKIIRQY